MWGSGGRVAYNPLMILCPACARPCLSIDLERVRAALAEAKVAPPGVLALFDMPGALLSRSVSKIAGERLGVRCPKCLDVSLSGGSNGGTQDGEGRGEELDAEARGFGQVQGDGDGRARDGSEA